MHKLAEIYEASGSIPEYIQSYSTRLANLVAGLDKEAIAQVVEAIDRASHEGKALYVMANGGSAAAASHLVNDLVAGCYKEGQPPFRTFSLTDNVESVTALGNDIGFESIFEYQLRVNMQPGDVVLGMSVSGNSENIIRAIDYAKANGATTIGYCGFDGGRLAERCDITVHAPTTKDEYGPVEDIFNILGHMVITYLAMKRGKYLHH